MGKTQSKSNTTLPHGKEETQNITQLPFNLGEPIVNVIDHVQKNFDLIEFHHIENNSAINPGSCDEAFKECNKPKNRYTFVVPYDTTRVKLQPIESEEGSDYINASWVHGQTYIATQGPLPSTFFDFWRMVWQYKIKVIMMLTKTFENDRMKCHRYWPEDKQTEAYNDFKVISYHEEEDEPTATTVRKFKLVNIKSDEEREVIHYQYHGWPDHGVPTNTTEIRELLRRMEQNNSSDSPVAVHCSAGIGRTGTLCTIHLTLGKIKEHVQKKGTEPYQFDLYTTVMSLRSERGGMVQQPEQYRFCYQSIIEGAKELGLQVPGLVESKIIRIDTLGALDAAEPHESMKTHKKKHKKNKNPEDPSTQTPVESDETKEPEVSTPENNGTEPHKKKKKKKKHVETNGTEPVNGSEEHSAKKKKKKKKKKPVEESLPTLDEPVTLPPDSPPSISSMRQEKDEKVKDKV